MNKILFFVDICAVLFAVYILRDCKGTQILAKYRVLTPFKAKYPLQMIVFKTAKDIDAYLGKIRLNGQSIGFVPTMGALHNGHIQLVHHAKRETDVVVCSIFVNPTQFNNAADFAKYPITIEKDIDMLEMAETDILFLPDVIQMYPGGLNTDFAYDLGYLETLLEGKFRPGHFKGVCQVVHRLLDIVKPGILFLGQKDYQQCMVIKRLIAILGMPVKLTICPTIREADGLAMSSRNMRLNSAERQQALRIYETLLMLKQDLKPGILNALKEKGVVFLTGNGFKVDYVEIADAETLEIVEEWDGAKKVVALIAAFLNEVRLIDNMPLNA
jgi:pantoate--beta-alanine ligase